MCKNPRLLMVAIGMLLSACSSAPVTQENSASQPTLQATSNNFQPSIYFLNVGDKISISVFQEPDLSGDFAVDSDGKINYPLLGRIPVAEKTTTQVEKFIAHGLSNGYLVNPDVRASVVGYKPIFVGGSVKSSGEYPFKPGLTVQQAVTLAGGLTRFAAEKYYIQRRGSRPEDQFRAAPDVLIYPGDSIFVEERLF